MTQHELDQINTKRRAQGKPALSMAQARSALDSNTSANITGADFLLGLAGVPMASPMGMAGYATHISTTPGTDYGNGCDTSSHVGSSSHDSGSSSFDSGGSCDSGGGGFSGGGD